MSKEDKITESISEIQIFIHELRVALANKKCFINVIEKKTSEIGRDIEQTNTSTINTLFPDEFPHVALRRELKKLDVRNYMYSMTDILYPQGNKLKVFGKNYAGSDIYIKLKLEFENDKSYENAIVLILSFHKSTRIFRSDEFPFEVENEQK
jgi:hypothetical protein